MIQIKPDHTDGWFGRACALNGLGRYQEEIETYDRLIRIKPDHVEAWYYRARALALLRRYDEALKSLDTVLQLQPGHGKAQSLRAEIKVQKPGRCFIATAVFGSPVAKDVLTLCAFRDSVLCKSDFGREFIQVYYRISPSIAHLIAHSKVIRWIVRTFLIRPLVRFVGSSARNPS